MSVLADPFVVPSRVKGVFRYLLHSSGQQAGRENVEKVLMPESLQRDRGPDRKANRDMVKSTIKECLEMGLLVSDEEGEKIALNPELPEEARSPETAEARLPLTLVDLLFPEANERNHDLGLATSWYLSQDAYEAPGDWETVSAILGQTSFAMEIGLNNSNPWGQLVHWTCYLGFGWKHSLGGKTVLTPDPTAHLRARLTMIFDGQPNQLTMSLPSVIEKLAKLSPVFEGGFLRSRMEQIVRQGSAGAEQRLSSVSALAWLRLHQEGTIKLEFRSDATPVLFPEEEKPYTHITWVGVKRQ
jgi:hypothetical protein